MTWLSRDPFFKLVKRRKDDLFPRHWGHLNLTNLIHAGLWVVLHAAPHPKLAEFLG